MATTIGALPSNMIASLASLTFAGSAVAEPALQSTSTDWVEIVTAGAIALATGLSFLFWYAASKPNVIVKPSWRSGVATVVITNVGKALAKDLRVSAESLPLGEGSDETLDICLPAMYPQEEIEYFVAVGNHAVNHEPYEFDLSHRRWFFRWSRETRNFKIDFKQYRHTLTEHHVTTPFEKDLADIARVGNTLIRMHVNNKDRFRLRKERVRRRARNVRKRLVSGFKRVRNPDG